jgi:hypothetical protein
MTKTLMILVASTALTAALGVPAWSAMHAPAQTEAAPLSLLLSGGEPVEKLILADADEGDDEGANVTRRAAQGDDEDDDSECDDEDGSCGAGAPAAAPAGSVAPPQNGLFGTGTPQVQVK